MSVNHIIIISVTEGVKQRLTQMGEEDHQLQAIQIGNSHENLTMLHFMTNSGEDDSNTSDEDLKYDDCYQKEFDNNPRENDCIMYNMDLMC